MSKYTKCLIRSEVVLLTPEERIRQSLLQQMIKVLGFPKGLISVEKKISQRRYDIVCFTRDMTPLVLIECKAKDPRGALEQALGYNTFLQAPFIAIAYTTKVITYWQDPSGRHSVDFLPNFKEMCLYAQRNCLRSGS